MMCAHPRGLSRIRGLSSIRGFSLIDLVVALAIGSFALMAAAKLTTWAVRKASQGHQQNELSGRLRLVGVQLRTDLALAGYGSTGAIGLDCAGAFSAVASICVTSAGGRPAIPAVRGADNITGGLLLDETDALQVVVPDPSTLVVTTQGDLAGSTQLSAPSPGACALGYVVDHSAPNGVGRTQLVRLNPGPGSPISTADPLLFDVYPGSEVMCARVSVYWVDASRALRRTDLNVFNLGAAVEIATTGIYLSIPAAGVDVVAPGVEDFQVAYAFSAMVGLPPGLPPDQRWAFGSGTVLVPAGADWFEARQVRFSALLRSLRRVEDTQALAQPMLENRALTPVTLQVSYSRRLLRGAEELTNLRIFDEAATAGLQAEPY